MSKKNRAPVPPAKRPASDFSSGKRWMTGDGFQNIEARLGIGTENQSSGASYAYNFISRNRQQLQSMYRTSWVVGQAVDVVAEDMTKAWVTWKGSIKPEQMAKLEAAKDRMQLADKLCDTIKWARLYGGAVAVLLIDGQKLNTPLRLDTVQKGQFKGLFVMDRWLVQPDLTDLVTDLGPDLGMPKWYDVVADSLALKRQRIHYSRLVRIDGVDLPYWERVSENLWGQSVIERLFDRLVAFDSTTLGVAQLVYKAHLRVIKFKGLREVVAAGGPALAGLVAQIDFIRRMQSNEGLTALDSEDEFDAHQYTFSGLDDVLLQFAQQLSGALQIPMVRLFGQSPAGLNATGESDLNMYYEKIAQEQNRRLRSPLSVIGELLCRSELGIDPPEDFGHDYNAIAEMSEKEKAELAKNVTDAVLGAEEQGVISQRTAVLELRQLSQTTGVFSNITDADVAAADDTLPDPNEVLNDPLADPATEPGEGPQAGTPGDREE